jgi:NADH-quinone oxidoreductase subunit L
VPPFSGFFSKDMIIDAAALSTIPGARYAYYCVLIGAFFTALYTFRALFMTFHGEPRMDSKTYHHVHESPFVVTFPLIVLAIPSLILGGILLSPMLLMKSQGMLGSSVMVLPSHDVLSKIADEGVNAMTLMTHAPLTPAFWLTLMGILSAWIGYIWRPQLPTVLAMRFHWLYCLLLNKFGFDALNEKVIIPLTKGLGIGFYQVGDKKLIDGLIISGTSSSFVRIANLAKRLQTGNLNQYAGVMMLTVLAFLCWMVLG